MAQPMLQHVRVAARTWLDGPGMLRASVRRLARARETGVFTALVLFAFYEFLAVGPSFATAYNVEIILKQMSVVAVIACGQTLVMIVGAFDLSQATLAGLTAMAAAMLYANLQVPPLVAIGLGLLLGLAVGTLNGLLAAYFRLNPIVLTLASGIAISGVTYFISRGYPVTGLPPQFLYLGAGRVLGIPVPIVLAITVAIGMHIMLTQTLFGRRILQVGGNVEAAKGLGLRINAVRTGVFAISGLMSAIGGLMIVGRLGAATPQIGSGLLFPVVTAVLIGGTLLSGGAGTMLGTLFGATVMAMVTNAIVLHQIDIFLIDTFQGGLVLVALLVDQFRRGELTVRKLVGRE